MWLIYGYRSREIWRPLRWWAVGSPCGAGVIVIVVDHDCGISRFGRWMIVEWSKECSHGSGMFFLMARAIVVWWPCLCGHILLSGLYWQKGALDRYRVVSIDGLWPMTHESLMTHTPIYSSKVQFISTLSLSNLVKSLLTRRSLSADWNGKSWENQNRSHLMCVEL